MSFGGGGFFGSGASQSESEETNTQQSQQAADQGNAQQLSGINFGKNGANKELNIVATDHGAIEAAFAGIDNVVDFARANSANSFELVDRAGEAIVNASLSALEYGAEATSAANEVISDLSGQSMRQVSDARTESLEFAAGGLEFFGEQINDTNARALNSVKSASDTALEFAAGAFGAAIDATKSAAATAENAFGNATKAVDKANTSENAQLAEYALYAAFGLVAVMAWRATK